MSEMFITMFDTPDGAAKLAKALEPLRKDYALEVQDITIVTRKDNGEIALKTPGNVPLLQVVGGAFWGVMFGAIVTVPLAGAALGAVVGAVTAVDHDSGVPSEFTERLGTELKPGGSALCLLVRDVDGEALLARLEETGLQGKVVSAPVPGSQAEELQAALSS